jgi:hypothetical protein
MKLLEHLKAPGVPYFAWLFAVSYWHQIHNHIYIPRCHHVVTFHCIQNRPKRMLIILITSILSSCRPQWLSGMRCRPWSLGLCSRGFESPLRHGCSSSSFCVMLSLVSRGRCDWLITHPEESLPSVYIDWRNLPVWGDQGSPKTVQPREKERRKDGRTLFAVI